MTLWWDANTGALSEISCLQPGFRNHGAIETPSQAAERTRTFLHILGVGSPLETWSLARATRHGAYWRVFVRCGDRGMFCQVEANTGGLVRMNTWNISHGFSYTR